MANNIFSTIDHIAATLVRDHLPSLRRFMLAVDMGEVACDEYQPSPGTTPECLLRYAEYWAWGATPGHARKLLENYPLPEALQAQLNQQAVHSSWTDLCYVPDEMKTEALIEKALEQSGFAIQYAPEPLITERLALLAVRQDGTSLQRIPDDLRTHQVCSEAVLNDINAMQYVPDEIRQQLL
ncbi:DUF4116 domain-containing protein [Pseudomonas sp. R-28-1W-6]|uniref:DUF4116 domain-containing protein n=1 Tax=Pseudomonas sp. R-28-1W-6 TaxID=2650101 RepID=UPI001365B597|nr:DUF4116 domain-containing protein [Pseudomonas sp. R-28-1W-6]MWV14179.1 DUF4116 domain-containing protein [Pseudomonas sp. R-28-1W-6]